MASSVAIAVTVTRSSHTKTLVEVGPSVRQTTITPATTSGETSTGSGTTTPTTTNKPPTPPIHSAGLIAWPGPPAYTVILASLPVQDGKEGPRQKALKALNAGLGDVGVLKSSNFSSLHANYYVVFSGVFKSQSAALARLPAARAAGFDSPYPKRVVP